MRDVKDKDSDGKFAHHVLKMHQHRDPKEQDGEVYRRTLTMTMSLKK